MLCKNQFRRINSCKNTIKGTWFRPKFSLDKSDIHIHVPEGATPKDGPSAGIGMCTALISVLTRIPVRADTAMTGEITLLRQVLKIGGLKEKLLATKRAGIKRVIIHMKMKQNCQEFLNK